MGTDLHRRLGAARMLCGLLLILPALATAESDEAVIIECVRPCTAAIAAVRGLGGRITEQFANVDAVAASVPKSASSQLSAALGSGQVSKDRIVASPIPRGAFRTTTGAPAAKAQVLKGPALGKFLEARPDNYLYTGALTGASRLHANGKIGAGVKVAVIDSGTANVAALEGSILGGENFVDGDFSANSTLNDNHGTWVGSMIAAHALFIFDSSLEFVQSIAYHLPGSAFPCPDPAFPGCPDGATIIPMIGTAPGAEIYALKVFPSDGGGAPESRIIAAMDRAITLRRNYNQGMPSVPVSGSGTEDDPYVYDSLKIEVVNMSLGGGTLFAGRSLEDKLTEKMLQVGMTIVTSAGNDGPAAMTGGSPGTGIGSLTTGAASVPFYERIVMDLQFGLGIGELWRPTNHIQTASFSARGPTADGRHDPQLVANGDWSFAQGADGGIWWVGGTSFSSPTVAGAAALLRDAGPNSATATQIRNALVDAGKPFMLGDKSGINDRGAGFLNVPNALNRLRNGQVSNVLPDKNHVATSLVALNVRRQGDDIVRFDDNGRFKQRVRNLVPGQMKQFFVPADKATDMLTVTLSNIVQELPPEQQNLLFGDDIFLNIVDAPTSFVDPPLVVDFVKGDTTYPIPNPQTGLVRVALQGDWTNAGRISADVTITRSKSPFGKATATGNIREGQQKFVGVEIEPGTAQAVFDLHWLGNWGAYPTNDLDLILIPPVGDPNFDGATFMSPERVTIDNPTPGIWTILVDGFTVAGLTGANPPDEWTLRVTADGKRLSKE